jgi:CheY-like chemotaxis protein
MGEEMTDFLAGRGPLPGRPLAGLTILVVEDSRFACEALRLLCLRSGARIRRADCLRSARRHLQIYRPTVAIVDLGLPDGSGLDLIGELPRQQPRVPAILAISGDGAAEGVARAAGADGFLAKPVESLVAFQCAVLGALSGDAVAHLVGDAGPDLVEPDPIALRDDLAHAAELLGGAPDAGTIDYVARFVSGLALSAHDRPLAAAAGRAVRDQGGGLAALNGLVRDRLAAGSAF